MKVKRQRRTQPPPIKSRRHPANGQPIVDQSKRFFVEQRGYDFLIFDREAPQETQAGYERFPTRVEAQRVADIYERDWLKRLEGYLKSVEQLTREKSAVKKKG